MASQHAFRNLNNEYLRRLINHQGWPWPRPKPTAEWDLVRLAMCAVEPDLSEAAIAQRILQYRSASVPKSWSSLLDDSTNVEALDGILDQEDMKSARVEANKAQAVKQSNHRKGSQKIGKPETRDGDAAARRVARLKVVVGDSFTREDVKAFLPSPTPAGCTMSKDDRRHMRWVGAYPR